LKRGIGLFLLRVRPGFFPNAQFARIQTLLGKTIKEID